MNWDNYFFDFFLCYDKQRKKHYIEVDLYNESKQITLIFTKLNLYLLKSIQLWEVKIQNTKKDKKLFKKILQYNNNKYLIK